jgi:hypothetical protein
MLTKVHTFTKYWLFSWALASRSAFRHPVSKSGTGAFQILDWVPLFRCRTGSGIGIFVHSGTRLTGCRTVRHLKKGYTLHIHTAGGIKGHTQHVHTTGGGRGYALHVHTAGGGKAYPAHCTSILLAVEIVTPCTSILLAVERDTVHPARPY